MGEVVQEAVNEANRKIVEDNKLLFVGGIPSSDIVGGQAEMEQVLEAKGDLAFTVAVETLPVFEVGAFDDVAIERYVVDVPEKPTSTRPSNRMADQQRAFNDKEGDAPAIADGDARRSISSARSTARPSRAVRARAWTSWSAPGASFQASKSSSMGAQDGRQQADRVNFPESYPLRAWPAKPRPSRPP